MDKKVSIVATGDCFISRRLGENKKAVVDIANKIGSADVRFTNLEVTTHNIEGYPNAFSGGTWAVAEPGVLDDLLEYNFNLFNCANNHSLDYSEGGLISTIENLNKRGMKYAGIGKNLYHASKPVYMETSSARVALISATTTFHESWLASEQRKDIIGRPGVNGIRIKSKYMVDEKAVEVLEELAEALDINSMHKLNIKEGFSVKEENECRFGAYKFIPSHKTYQERFSDERDKKRILDSIKQAKMQSGYVLLSLHSHEMKGENKNEPADFFCEFARECIDAGASAILGHGPHIVRGIEIYKGCPIFYSLGNFIFQNETVSVQPSEFYEKYNLGSDDHVSRAYEVRNQNGTVGLGVNKKVWESVIAEFSFEEDQLIELKLHPIELGFGMPNYRRGWPKLTDKHKVIEELAKLSECFGTKIEYENGVGVVRI